jgi:hypothetical protein
LISMLQAIPEVSFSFPSQGIAWNRIGNHCSPWDCLPVLEARPDHRDTLQDRHQALTDSRLCSLAATGGRASISLTRY